MRIKTNSLALLCLFFSSLVRPDSPLTSSYIFTPYVDYREVQEARLTRNEANPKIYSYLLNPAFPLDIKVAIVNARGFWVGKPGPDASGLTQAIETKYRVPIGTALKHLPADELLTYAYSQVLNNHYFNPSTELWMFNTVVKKLPNSFTAAVLQAMTHSNGLLNGMPSSKDGRERRYCEIWLEMSKVLKNPSLDQDMRTDAMVLISDYAEGYKKYCPQSK